MRCKETITVLQFLYNISRIEHLYIAIHSWHNSRKGPLKLTDKIRSLKRKENGRKLRLLGIQTGDNLAKPLFFVTYSRLCRHCRNLVEEGCLLPRFHFTLRRWVMLLVGIYPGRASVEEPPTILEVNETHILESPKVNFCWNSSTN